MEEAIQSRFASNTPTFPAVDAPINLNEEANRILTFINWPKPFICPTELAKWGFYYTDREDVVRCVFCEVELGHWEQDDIVWEEHLRWRPSCMLLRRQPTNNVPLDSNFLEQIRIVPDVVGFELNNYSIGDNQNVLQEISLASQAVHEQEFSIERVKKIDGFEPKHPQYAIPSDRLKTFQTWPLMLKPLVSKLVDAGFFYTGTSDSVTCFCCDISLDNWQLEDDPWHEHARFIVCAFVTLVKAPETSCKLGSTAKKVKTGEIDTLENTAKVMNDEQICKICNSKQLDTIFIPCGHVAACDRCAAAVDKCPICNVILTDFHSIYFS